MGNIFKRELYIAKVDKLSQGNRNRKEPLPWLFTELLKSYLGHCSTSFWVLLPLLLQLFPERLGYIKVVRNRNSED